MQAAQLSLRGDKEWNAFGAKQRLVTNLLAGQNVGHGHQSVTYGAQLLGALETKRAARAQVDVDLATRGLCHRFSILASVLNHEIAVRQDTGKVELGSSKGRVHGGCHGRDSATGDYELAAVDGHDQDLLVEVVGSTGKIVRALLEGGKEAFPLAG